jgi:hypothetical protein
MTSKPLDFLIKYIYIGHFKYAKDDALAFARAILLVYIKLLDPVFRCTLLCIYRSFR